MSRAAYRVATVVVPLAEAGSRFTLLFERLAITGPKKATPTAVGRRLGRSWDEACAITERAVRHSLACRQSPVQPHLGIEEPSFLKRHHYVSVVVDLDAPRILHVAADRKATSLTHEFTTLTETHHEGIAASAMEIWAPYRKTIHSQVHDADSKIIFDKLLPLQHVSTAVDHVREQEYRVLLVSGDTRLTLT